MDLLNTNYNCLQIITTIHCLLDHFLVPLTCCHHRLCCWVVGLGYNNNDSPSILLYIALLQTAEARLHLPASQLLWLVGICVIITYQMNVFPILLQSPHSKLDPKSSVFQSGWVSTLPSNNIKSLLCIKWIVTNGFLQVF
jgi:hypothetical protein